jgi:hypothetical protein
VEGQGWEFDAILLADAVNHKLPWVLPWATIPEMCKDVAGATVGQGPLVRPVFCGCYGGLRIVTDFKSEWLMWVRPLAKNPCRPGWPVHARSRGTRLFLLLQGAKIIIILRLSALLSGPSGGTSDGGLQVIGSWGPGAGYFILW